MAQRKRVWTAKDRFLVQSFTEAARFIERMNFAHVPSEYALEFAETMSKEFQQSILTAF